MCEGLGARRQSEEQVAVFEFGLSIRACKTPKEFRRCARSAVEALGAESALANTNGEARSYVEEYIAQRARCIAEWGNVNDPPCHPSDKGWKPCDLCR